MVGIWGRSIKMLAVLICLCAGALQAQEAGRLNVALASADPAGGSSASAITTSIPDARPRVADKSFWRMVSLTAGSAIFDGETTMRGLQHPGTREVTPLLGARPDRPRFYATVGAVDVGMAIFSWHLKKTGHDKAWKLPLLGATTMHLGGAANNLRY